MSMDPITGPMPRAEFKALVEAPFGEATKAIRKYDPLFGRKPGEKLKWEVRCRSTMEGWAYVEAENEDEADKLAAKLSCNDVDWCDYSDDFEVLDITPSGR